ncbi:MAG: DUF167 domain-containing protein [Candidatus Moraniibacteriota bacterium]|nr:MAG: DUF167 domain-containing protein [Candidatus Moranbacteria bacterium]
MKIFVKVKAGARTDFVERKDETHFFVLVKAQPEHGKANVRVEKLLAKFLDISRSRISLRSGIASKQKVFDIDMK